LIPDATENAGLENDGPEKAEAENRWTWYGTTECYYVRLRSRTWYVYLV